MRRYIPSFGGIDSASIILLLLLQVTNTVLKAMILGVSPGLAGIFVVAVAELLDKTVWIFLGAIIIGVVISWVAQGAYNPVVGVIDSLTRPLLDPARRVIPPLGALDLSPLIAILVLQLVRILIVAPISDMGARLL